MIPRPRDNNGGGNNNVNDNDNGEGEGEGDNHNDPMELLMRHSSPFIATREGTVTSPSTERNSSPSPLRLTRPRSNPRNRTPMRYQSPLTDTAFRIPEEGTTTTQHHHNVHAQQQQQQGGITIRPTAGRAVGTALSARAAFRNTGAFEGRRAEGAAAPTMTRSRKQGPSHRKIRRWNNDNFVNLAAEINSGNKGGRAAQALLLGHASAAQYRGIVGHPDEKAKTAMTRLQEDDSLKDVREQFFEGELNAKPAEAATTRRRSSSARDPPATPEEMLLRIEPRLRRVLIKACENSMPASSVVEHVEAVLVRAHSCVGKKPSPTTMTTMTMTTMTMTTDNNTNNNDEEEEVEDLEEDSGWWKDLLIQPPSITHRKRDDTYITRFLFDGDSPNGGFHRLLLHGLCQFHGLRASSSTTEVTPLDDKNKTNSAGGSGTNTQQADPPVVVQARLLMATGTIAEACKNVKMVDYIMLRKELKDRHNNNGFEPVPPVAIETRLRGVDDATSALQALKV